MICPTCKKEMLLTDITILGECLRCETSRAEAKEDDYWKHKEEQESEG